MSRDDWNRLIEALDDWTSAVEIAPGHIEVALSGQDGTNRRVVMVMTPDQWDDMAGVMWGDFDSALADVKATLLEMQSRESFAVYPQYRLEPSITASLSKEPPGPPFAGGQWVTYDREGRITSRFADWSEPEDRS
ncbi:hypothetical protein [Nocardioides sp. MH1]|uniref:hypothetical protein n=1 Tax=Nocardioides sp. MH1 TaxID=3242490 RepID=UPI0035229B35